MEEIKRIISDSLKLKEKIKNDKKLISSISSVVDLITTSYASGGKLLLCGNGGSAADAQHISAEFSGRFYMDRRPLFAESLTVNTSYLTAVANDYGYDEVFSRLVESKGSSGDVLIGITTSGSSVNVIKALENARKIGMSTVSLSGSNIESLKGVSDYCISVPSTDTPRIQEAHIMIGHIFCELVEKNLFHNE